MTNHHVLNAYWVLRYLIWSPQQPYMVHTVTILTLQRGKLRLREVNTLAEVTQMVSGASGTPEPKLIITTLMCSSPTHLSSGGEARSPRGHRTQCGPSI